MRRGTPEPDDPDEPDVSGMSDVFVPGMPDGCSGSMPDSLAPISVACAVCRSRIQSVQDQRARDEVLAVPAAGGEPAAQQSGRLDLHR
jgi:hypothetical protein